MSYDVTGGGPMEAPRVELSVPALKLFQSHLVSRYSQKRKKSKVLLSLVVALYSLLIFKILLRNSFKERSTKKGPPPLIN